MKKEIPKKFGTSVFINCPFDEEYKLLLQPILFTLVYVGLCPRLASETSDSLEPRIEKILRLIQECKYSIHDLSRLKSQKANEFARLNMFSGRRKAQGYSKADLTAMPVPQYIEFIKQWIASKR